MCVGVMGIAGVANLRVFEAFSKLEVLNFQCHLAYEPNVALEYPPELFCRPGGLLHALLFAF